LKKKIFTYVGVVFMLLAGLALNYFVKPVAPRFIGMAVLLVLALVGDRYRQKL